MAVDDNKLEALFEQAVKSQERLARSQPGESEGEELLPIEEELEPAGVATATEPALAPEPDEPGDESARPKKASDAVTEALIKAKNEAVNALEQTQHEAKSLHERLLRVSADFENFRKRTRKQQAEAAKFANESLLKELLPVLDNFERALEHAGEESQSALFQGIQMVQQQLVDALGKYGLKGFSALHQSFDPTFQEAVEQVQTAEHPAGKVVREYQKGYLLNERLLRPALVAVAMPPATGGPAETDTDDAGADAAGADEPSPAGTDGPEERQDSSGQDLKGSDSTD